jgi:hypothetical protein
MSYIHRQESEEHDIHEAAGTAMEAVVLTVRWREEHLTTSAQTARADALSWSFTNGTE